jgi:hypothetical protein
MHPRISLVPFEQMEFAIVRHIVDREGRIRESRPEITDPYSGCAAYVWRMVCFIISPNPKYQCLPVMATDYVPQIPEREKLLDWLDALTDKILTQIPTRRWLGIVRWRDLI